MHNHTELLYQCLYRKPWSDGKHSITVWCFIIDCTVLLQGNRLDSTFAGKQTVQYFSREIDCTVLLQGNFKLHISACLIYLWPFLCLLVKHLDSSNPYTLWVRMYHFWKLGNGCKHSEDIWKRKRKRLCGLFCAAPWVMWTCRLWLKSKKLCATHKLEHLVGCHNTHKFHPMYQHSWKLFAKWTDFQSNFYLLEKKKITCCFWID